MLIRSSLPSQQNCIRLAALSQASMRSDVIVVTNTALESAVESCIMDEKEMPAFACMPVCDVSDKDFNEIILQKRKEQVWKFYFR